MLRSLMAKLKITKILSPIAVSASANLTSINNAGFGSLMFLVAAGAFAYDGINYMSISVEHCDDNATFVPVVAGDLYLPENVNIAKILNAAGDADAIHTVHYLGSKQYVRLVLTETGICTGIIGVEAIQGHPEQLPPA